MAKVAYIDLDAPDEDLFYGNLTAQSRFVHARVSRKVTLLSRKRKLGVSARSLLPQIALIWNALSDLERESWSNAGAVMGLNGWRLFVQDQTARILNEIAGSATPSLLHQSWVGKLLIASPAIQIKLAQYHPHSYWVSRPVPKHKGMREPVVVTEDVALPIALSINYKSNLVSLGAGSFAKYFVEVRSSYQGIDRFATAEINFDLISDWKNGIATISSVQGYVIGYTLYIHLYNVRGSLEIDNVKATHSGQNWVRDSFCKNIDQVFTKTFYQIPENWVAIELPVGSEYNSIYPV